MTKHLDKMKNISKVQLLQKISGLTAKEPPRQR